MKKKGKKTLAMTRRMQNPEIRRDFMRGLIYHFNNLRFSN